MHSLIRWVDNSKMTQICFLFNSLLWLLSVTTAFGTRGLPATVTSSRSASSNVASGVHSVFRSTNSVGSSYMQLVTSLQGGYDSRDTDLICLDRLIDAFEQTTVYGNDVIMNQGEMCDATDDFMYVVGNGECTVSVDGKVIPEPYGTLKPRAIFGELSFMYNKTRAATVKAASDTVSLFRVKGEIIISILNEHHLLPTSKNDLEQLERINEAISEVEGAKSFYGGNIIRPYKPNRLWLWRRWRGTVFQHNYKTVLGNMLFSLAFIFCARQMTGSAWSIGMPPDKNHPFIQRLDVIRHLWNYQMSLTTFILTFFLNQAYGYWKHVLSLARRIQGRLNDFSLLLATSAKRENDGTYTPESKKLLDDIGASSRLFHTLFWASCARRFSVLNTPMGLECLASRGLMTSRQLQVLQGLNVPVNQRHNACLEWMMIRAWQGIDEKVLRSDCNTRLMDQMCQLRGTYASIGDELSTRMPLPYTHMVQILVDCFIFLAPVALYPDLGVYSIFGVGILTLFYAGLLDLSKIFLDPLDNEDFSKNSLDMDLGVLIRESNAGSTRWKNAGANLPF